MHPFAATAIAIGLSFLYLVVLFWPMELVFPARKQKLIRPDWVLDLCFFLGQYLLWTGLVFWALSYFNDWVFGIVPQGFRATVAALPFWLQVLLVIILSDFFIYWAHRLQHHVEFLWRFHKVHHSSKHLDWLAAHREHPLDTIYTVGIINLPAILLGFSLESIAGFIAFRGIWAIYIHSNVRLPIGPIRMLIGAPELHHWHHDLDRRAGNYANISPLMDILFGTYTCPDHEPEAFGIAEPMPKHYLGQMLCPLLPELVNQKLFPTEENKIKNEAKIQSEHQAEPPADQQQT